MKRAAWSLAVLALASGASPRAADGPSRSLPFMETTACRAILEAQLASWDITGDVFQDPPDPVGSRSWRLPTGRPGVWVVVTASRDRVPTIARVDVRETRRVVVDDACAVELHVEPMPPVSSADNAFDDQALVALLNRNRAGVIYVWSPHMPLSVDAYASVERATRALGVAMTAVLDPLASSSYARSVASSSGLPGETLRPFHSVLTFHISKNNYLTVFVNGGIARPAITDVVVVDLTRNARGDIVGYGGMARVTTSQTEGLGSYFPAFFPDGGLFYISNAVPKNQDGPKRFEFTVVDPAREIRMANFFSDDVQRTRAAAIGDLWRGACAPEMQPFKDRE